MHTNSVRAAGPPDQDTRPVIREWRTEGYKLALRDTGSRGAEIVCTTGGETVPYGHIEFDLEQDRHIIEWNRDGRLALEEYKRNHWDTWFYIEMAKAGR
jgi:hypothetical protein